MSDKGFIEYNVSMLDTMERIRVEHAKLLTKFQRGEFKAADLKKMRTATVYLKRAAVTLEKKK